MSLEGKIENSKAAIAARKRVAVKKNKIMSSRLKTKREKIVEDFDSCAQTWGWESDQGTGQRVINAESDYRMAKKKLLAYIERLQKKERKL